MLSFQEVHICWCVLVTINWWENRIYSRSWASSLTISRQVPWIIIVTHASFSAEIKLATSHLQRWLAYKRYLTNFFSFILSKFFPVNYWASTSTEIKLATSHLQRRLAYKQYLANFFDFILLKFFLLIIDRSLHLFIWIHERMNDIFFPFELVMVYA